MMYIIPIILIGGIFVVFYMFKDKFMAKTVNNFNESAQKWAEDKDGVIAEFYTNPEKFKMIKDAVEGNVDSMVGCKPKKGIGKKILKGAMEMLTSTETFDMSAYYLVISGNDLHFLQSDGKTIVEHAVFDLNAIENVEMKKDSGAMKAAKYIMSSGGTNDNFYWLSFISKGETYEFKVDEFTFDFASFSVTKGVVVNRKHGQNPFSRVHGNVSSVDLSLVHLYAQESIPKFAERMASLKRR